MQPIPPYWARRERVVTGVDGRGRPKELRLVQWGSSTRSDAEAGARAEQRLSTLAQLVALGTAVPDGWYYPDRVVHEEVVQDVSGPDGSMVAQVTRNRYGALILNTDALLIADVDVPVAGPPRRGLLRRTRPLDDTALARARERIVGFAARYPGWGVHPYRTFGGFRVLVTGTGALPGHPAAHGILTELASDPLYVRLCVAQGTYRARLSPKPWRVGVAALDPRSQWPATPDLETGRRTWIRRYEAAAEPFATCHRETAAPVDPSTVEQVILALHDRLTRAASSLPLA